MVNAMRGKTAIILAGALTALALFIVGDGHTQLAGGDFEVRRSTIDAGGDVSSGGEFELGGTIGQPDTGASSGGAFEVFAGFWTPPSSDLLFKDSYER